MDAGEFDGKLARAYAILQTAHVQGADEPLVGLDPSAWYAVQGRIESARKAISEAYDTVTGAKYTDKAKRAAKDALIYLRDAAIGALDAAAAAKDSVADTWRELRDKALEALAVGTGVAVLSGGAGLLLMVLVFLAINQKGREHGRRVARMVR